MIHPIFRSHRFRYLVLAAIATSTMSCGSQTPPATPGAATPGTATSGQPPTPPVAVQPAQPGQPAAAPSTLQQPAAPTAPNIPNTTNTLANPAAIAMAPAAGVLTAQSAGAQINVRSAPSVSASTPHYGVPGDTVTLEQYVNGSDGYIWYNVRFNTSGATGWVRGDFVTTDATVASAPENPPVTGSGISQTIQFDPGASSATLSGSVVRGTQDTYYVSASPGQSMQVDASSPEGNAVFQIYGEVEGSWTPLLGAEPGQDTTTWHDTLPGGGTGNYMIVVGSSRGNTEYSLYVGIQ